VCPNAIVQRKDAKRAKKRKENRSAFLGVFAPLR
jgi:hypothetical protein